MCRFFDISLGSLAELVAGADNLLKEGFIEKSEFEMIYKQALVISKQIQGMQHRIKKSPLIKSRKKEAVSI